MPKSGKTPTHQLWRKVALGRLRFELGGLAFALQKGATPEEYAHFLWGKGAKSWMGKVNPGAEEYLRKEAEAFRCFYPDVAFEVLETGENRAGLVFTGGCLGAGDGSWALAESFGLTREDVCRYCHEAFRVWAKQLGLSAHIGPGEDGNCRLNVRRDRTKQPPG